MVRDQSDNDDDDAPPTFRKEGKIVPDYNPHDGHDDGNGKADRTTRSSRVKKRESSRDGSRPLNFATLDATGVVIRAKRALTPIRREESTAPLPLEDDESD
jgi:hypothetical protein